MLYAWSLHRSDPNRPLHLLHRNLLRFFSNAECRMHPNPAAGAAARNQHLHAPHVSMLANVVKTGPSPAHATRLQCKHTSPKHAMRQQHPIMNIQGPTEAHGSVRGAHQQQPVLRKPLSPLPCPNCDACANTGSCAAVMTVKHSHTALLKGVMYSPCGVQPLRQPLLEQVHCCCLLSPSSSVRVNAHEKLTLLPFSSVTLQLTLPPSAGMRASGACSTSMASPALGLLVRALKADTLGVRCSGLPGGMTVPAQHHSKAPMQVTA
jgi:hypothetical protein